MSLSARSVTPELLDDLDPDDPRAQRSRRDLRRVHTAMGSVRILRQLLEGLRAPEGRPFAAPHSILELGAGDGTLLLRLARTLRPPWQPVELTLLDRNDLVSAPTRAAYRELGWHINVIRADVFEWLRTPFTARYDLCMVNLFLHHFKDQDLAALLAGSAARTDAFISCEPHRDQLSRLGSLGVGLLGANAVTREDAVKSVNAGFRAGELGRLWPSPQGKWRLHEFRALPFTHCFSAFRLVTDPAACSHGI